MSTLLEACIGGDLASVERVLDSTPACVHERDEVLGARGVRELLALGAPVDERVRKLMGESASTATPLHLAAEGGHVDVATLLLEAGADPDARAADTDQTPLHRAVVGRHAGMVRLLLARGADPSIEDRQFHATPAGWADFEGDATLAAAFGTSG